MSIHYLITAVLSIPSHSYRSYVHHTSVGIFDVLMNVHMYIQSSRFQALYTEHVLHYPKSKSVNCKFDVDMFQLIQVTFTEFPSHHFVYQVPDVSHHRGYMGMLLLGSSITTRSLRESSTSTNNNHVSYVTATKKATNANCNCLKIVNTCGAMVRTYFIF